MLSPAKVREKDQRQLESAAFGLFYRLRSARTGLQKLWEGGVDAVAAGDFDAYVCSRCGYTEWDASPSVVNKALAEVAKSPETGVSLLDS